MSCTHETKPRPLWRLALGLFIMLGAAALELTVGFSMQMHALLADGLHMLGHGLHLLVILVLQLIVLKMPTRSKPFEAFAAMGIALFIMVSGFVMLVDIGLGGDVLSHRNEHGHDAEQTGYILIAVGLLSLAVHTFVAKVLYNACAHPLVMGACIYVASHAFMAGGIVFAGVLSLLTHWPYIDAAIALMVALFMIFASGKLLIRGYRHYRPV